MRNVGRSLQEHPLGSWDLIGDRRTGALVGPFADIGWWAPRHLADAAAFYALVDPAGALLSTRLRAACATSAYRAGDAPIRSTEVRSHDGVIVVHDVVSDGTNGPGGTLGAGAGAPASGTLIRVIEVRSGLAELDVNVLGGTRFAPPRRTFRSSDGIAWVAADPGSAAIAVRGLPGDASTLVLRAGEWHCVTISPDARDTRMRREEFDRMRAEVERRWRQHLDGEIDGPYRPRVRAWLLRLALLRDRESGALLRSATTSLPAQIGGERQIDERLAHLDDSARLVRLLERIGRHDLAQPTRVWLHDALDQGFSRARRADGSDAGDETDLLLGGWRGHSPVRSSDVGAATMDLAAVAAASMVIDGRELRTIRSVGERLARAVGSVDTSDRGRWGGRAPKPRPAGSGTELVSSAIAVRSALLAIQQTERRNDPLSTLAYELGEAVQAITGRLLESGCTGRGNSSGDGAGAWRRAWATSDSDAQLLRWIAPPDPVDPFPALPDDGPAEAATRTRNTVERILGELDDHGLLHRHLPALNDGFAPGQGADVAVSAEMVSALCRLRRWEDANLRMERLLAAIDAGARTGPAQRGFDATVPSHLDPRTSAHLGNRPAAPALLALCEAALALHGGPL